MVKPQFDHLPGQMRQHRNGQKTKPPAEPFVN